MRRATARGRVFPQFFSTDRRFSRLSVKAIALFPLMWTNADDQGRLTGDPDEIKFTCCPGIDHITKAEVPQLLAELADNNLILLYNTPKFAAIQMLDWWSVHYKLQWAWPSDFPSADGWVDHLRYKKDAKTVVTSNWPVSPENSPENSPETSPETSHFALAGSSLPPLLPEKEEEEEEEEEIHLSAQVRPAASATGFSTDRNKLSAAVMENFQLAFGRVTPEAAQAASDRGEHIDPADIIQRQPDARELAQMRDMVTWLIKNGGCPVDYIRQSFGEAAGQHETSKHSITYVKAILSGWLKYPKELSP